MTEIVTDCITLKDFGWVSLQLMGHDYRIGKASEVPIAGTTFIRIECPIGYNGDIRTEFYPSQAIYCLTPITEKAPRKHLDDSPPITQQPVPEDGIPF